MHATQELVADPATPAHTLRAAARYLLHCGWYQGDLFDLPRVDGLWDPQQATPAACALGAIRMALLGTPDASWYPQAAAAFDQAVAAMADHLILFYGVDDFGASDLLGVDAGCVLQQVVTEWNDAWDRIASHVIAGLQGAADEWDRIHGGAV